MKTRPAPAPSDPLGGNKLELLELWAVSMILLIIKTTLKSGLVKPDGGKSNQLFLWSVISLVR